MLKYGATGDREVLRHKSSVGKSVESAHCRHWSATSTAHCSTEVPSDVTKTHRTNTSSKSQYVWRFNEEASSGSAGFV